MNSDNMHHFLKAFIATLRELLRKDRLLFVAEEDISLLVAPLVYFDWPDEYKPADLIHGWLLLMHAEKDMDRPGSIRAMTIYSELAKEGAQLLLLQKVCEQVPIAAGMGGYLFALTEQIQGTAAGARALWAWIISEYSNGIEKLSQIDRTSRRRMISFYRNDLAILGG